MKKKENGFTLIEMLVVLGVFSILSLMVVTIITFSIRGSRKSEVTSNLRSKLSETLEVMSRQLRNAQEITTCGGSPPSVEYKDQDDNPAFFSCSPAYGQIASGSGSIADPIETYYLIESGVDLEDCSITCPEPEIGIPAEITIKIKAKDSGSQWPESALINLETKVVLRNKKN